MALQSLSATANSWCWFGMNLPEECDEPVLEKLAVRFKNEEIWKRFQQVVDNCISVLIDKSNVTDGRYII